MAAHGVVDGGSSDQVLIVPLLVLQAYAVQGQHAIPQPDVSEGPSVSDPIYFPVGAWSG